MSAIDLVSDRIRQTGVVPTVAQLFTSLERMLGFFRIIGIIRHFLLWLPAVLVSLGCRWSISGIAVRGDAGSRGRDRTLEEDLSMSCGVEGTYMGFASLVG